MPQDSDVKINIVAQTRQAISNLLRLNLSLDNLVSGLINFGVRVLQAAADLAKLGIEIQAVQTKGQLLLDSLGAYEAHVRAAQEATKGLITEQQAMVLVNDLVQFGFTQTTEETAELARQILVMSGGNVEASQSFIRMLTNASPQRLDEFGLSAAKTKKRISELQQATAGLSYEEAFAIAVKEQLAAKTEQLSGVMETNAAKVQRSQAAIQDLKADLGESMANAIGPVIDLFDAFDQKIKDSTDSTIQAENAIAYLQASITAFGVATAMVVDGQIELNQFMDAYAVALEQMSLEMGAYTTAESRAADEAAAAAVARKQAATAAQDESEALEHLGKVIETTNRVLDDQKNKMLSLMGAFEETSATVNEGGLQGGAATIAEDEAGMSDEDFLKLGLQLLIKEGAPLEYIWEYRKAAGLADPGELAKEQAMLNLVQQAASGNISAQEYLAGIQGVRAGNIPEMTEFQFGLGIGQSNAPKSNAAGSGFGDTGGAGERMAKNAAEAVASEFNKAFPKYLEELFAE